MKYISHSLADTEKIAEELSAKLQPGSIITLSGKLGTGKTCFVQMIAKQFGVNGYINSPSYTILNQYQGRYTIYHLDFYRLDSLEQILEIGIDEIIYGQGITFIEWPELIEPILPKNCVKVYFRYLDETSREIIIKTAKDKNLS
ncbi:MAG: tRNA (adenosine(37)-N6)-threonylcarbamoyltransferase complex ATPase subunit type 1 TsaE [Candidatus Cloacimonadota bacterium]|nr:MAG: tRNA (adenosine(37)-N6)-threonylcarbamoyltransferase complex ATPase subunit type 1 TsaE [Candidatus Cloacimonadota bacterium]